MNALADQAALNILARADELGYDLTRVAIALGIDPGAHRLTGQNSAQAPPPARRTPEATNADAAPQQ